MGMGELFRRLFTRPAERERLSFAELDAWIARKEEAERRAVSERLTPFLAELDEQLSLLERVDVEEKKADPRAKAISQGNLKTYLAHLRLLRERLGDGNDVRESLLDFSRKSERNYQKATLLVGEVGETRKLIGAFGRCITETAVHGPVIASLKGKAAALTENEALIAAAAKEIRTLRREMAAAAAKERAAEKAIERQNAEAQRQEEEYGAALAALRKEILRLKGMIDLKALGHAFHGTQRMSAVLSLKERFDAEEALPLVEEAGLATPEMRPLLERIRAMRQALQPPTLQRRRYVKERSLDEKKAAAERRIRKAEQERERLRAAIREELAGIGVEIA